MGRGRLEAPQRVLPQRMLNAGRALWRLGAPQPQGVARARAGAVGRGCVAGLPCAAGRSRRLWPVTAAIVWRRVTLGLCCIFYIDCTRRACALPCDE